MQDPINTWTVRRGENITQTQIEHELGYRQADEPSRYFSDLMKLTRECHAILKANGEPSTIRNCDNGIQILASSEAMNHQVRRGRSARAKMIESFQRLQDTVDIGELSPDGRRIYEDALRTEGAYIHSIQRVRRSLRTTGHLVNEVPKDPQERRPRRRL